VCSTPVSRSLIKSWKRTGPKMEPWGTPLVFYQKLPNLLKLFEPDPSANCSPVLFYHTTNTTLSSCSGPRSQVCPGNPEPCRTVKVVCRLPHVQLIATILQDVCSMMKGAEACRGRRDLSCALVNATSLLPRYNSWPLGMGQLRE